MQHKYLIFTVTMDSTITHSITDSRKGTNFGYPQGTPGWDNQWKINKKTVYLHNTNEDIYIIPIIFVYPLKVNTIKTFMHKDIIKLTHMNHAV